MNGQGRSMLLIIRQTCSPHHKVLLLEQISIIRTHVPFLRLFKLRQPKIRTRLVPIPVLHQHAGSVDTASRRAQAGKANADAIARFVTRGILGLESVRGDDAADIAEADLPRCSDRSAMVAAEVEIEPADDDRERRVRAHRDEEQRSVFEMRPRVHSQ